MNIGQLRKQYDNEEFSRQELRDDPFVQFESWFSDALRSKYGEPNAMVLATAGSAGIPTSRYVLLKEIDGRGFLFFTNFESRKAVDLGENPRASLTFFWEPFVRQVHIRGEVERLTPEECDRYFASRPRESQLSAWASHQDQVIENRAVLEEAFEAADREYKDVEVPRPPYWGGYRVVPSEFEFWQGRPHRLHDRFLYTKSDGNWQIVRLSP